MPIYEFECNSCKNRFSELRKMGDFAAKCPGCESDDVKKMMSSFSSKSTSAGASYSPPASSCSSGG